MVKVGMDAVLAGDGRTQPKFAINCGDSRKSGNAN
jgi:hypothetical protein